MNDILLKQDDVYEIQLASIISNYDEKVLFRLYQPIIGYGPINLFFTLFHEIEGEKIVTTGLKKHNRLFEQMLINNDKFLRFRRYLEAVGLLKTFVLEDEESNRYIYRLYAPLMPNKFFAHPILNNLFKRNVSIEEYDRTKQYFINKIIVKSTYREISTSINEIFFNDLKNIKTDEKDDVTHIKERLEGEINSLFDFEAFIVGLKDYQIPKKLLTNSVLKEIANFAVLYKISAIDMRQVVANSLDYDGDEKKINLDKLEHFSKVYYELNVKNSRVKKAESKEEKVKVTILPGNSSISKKVQLFNDIDPIEFLKIRNNNKSPSSYEVELVKRIKDNTDLRDPVINVLLDYSLEKLDGKLIPKYVETVASSLNRKNIKDAYEAMLYLNGKTPKESKNDDIKTEKKTPSKVVKEEPLEEEFKWWD